jgi:cytochrome c-type biogenesis protein CcsB
MDYLYFSVILFNVATYGYLLASMVLIANLVSKKEYLIKIFKVMGIVIVASHTSALLCRWLQAGFDRPPWTNLYESLIFFTWGLGMVSTVVILRYRTYFLATFLYPLAFAGLGLAAMVPDKSITPLVPSLQSYWIKIHVVMASMAYPGFITAATISLAYLLKSKTALEKLSVGFATVMLFTLGVVGRTNVFINGFYEIPQTAFEAGKFVKIPIDPEAKPVQFVQAMIPGAGALFWATALCLLVSILYSFGALKDPTNRMWRNMNRFFSAAGVACFGLLLAVVYYNIGTRDDMSINSNMYEMAILWCGFLLGVFFTVYTYLRERIDAILPSADWLDEFAYKITLFAFPFMTLLLITGAIWAYSAWGRYWGWDPKETCALMTWLIFAAYLHSRRYLGTLGRPAAVISVVGGISVFFTFLGANLFLSGLHSYGAQ